MSQKIHIVKCFSCKTFQVDIVKKIPKWTCKMCGKKQALRKVYGQGTGRDCRLLVQHANLKQLLQQKVFQTAAEELAIGENCTKSGIDLQHAEHKSSESSVEDVSDESEDRGPSNSTFERQ